MYESEGYDRTHMRMPDCQNRLIEAVAAANPNTVVVLYNGSPVEMPWIGSVKAVLEAYLGGQAVGLATVRVLFGEVNPSGKLPESFPKQLADNPSYLDTAEYREGIFVGYRYYDRKETELLFPFGHGLSYTSFDFSDLRLSRERITDQESLTATVRVTNTGKRAGKTVVQLYVGDCESSVFRPVRELKGFEKIFLEPGESKDVSFTLDKRSFAYWNTKTAGGRHADLLQAYMVYGGDGGDPLPVRRELDLHGPDAGSPRKYGTQAPAGRYPRDVHAL